MSTSLIAATGRSTFLAQDKVDLIKRTVAKGATDDELQLFLHHCERTRLDPLARQIYFRKQRTKNGDQILILTSIDGYRLTAQRTDEYAGNDDPIFDNEDAPRKATVTVYRVVKGVRCPFTATARWDQYYPGDQQGFMWRKMPHLMIGKCAEALALRKAFPQELSGLYITEEMDQATTFDVASTPAVPELLTDDGIPFGPAPRQDPPPQQDPPRRGVYDGSAAHQQALRRVLIAKKVPEEMWEAVSERLKGRSSADIDRVLAELEQ